MSNIFQETGLAEKWIRQTLLADSSLATLGNTDVFGYDVPQGTAGPCLVFGLVTGTDENSVNGTRNGTDSVFYVKCVHTSSDSSLAERIMGRADELLQKAGGSLPGLVVRSCHRESILKYPEKFQGRLTWHVGGQYRLEIGQANA